MLEGLDDLGGGGEGGHDPSTAEAIVLDAGGDMQPLPMAVRVVPAANAAKAALDAGDRSLRSIVGRLGTRVLAEHEWRAFDPDRDTLVQASAVTFIFVAVMAAYLGGLDAAFNWFVKQLL